MIDQNIPEFEKMNLNKWHSYGYKGKGANLVVLDVNGVPHEFTNVIQPIPSKYEGIGHQTNVCSVVREIAPEATIYSFHWSSGFKDEIVKWIDEHQDMIDAINFSVSGRSVREEFKELEKFDIPIFVSSGNDGNEDKINPYADLPWTIGVGAWNEINDGAVSYSNAGEGVDVVAYTNIYIPSSDGYDRVFAFNGTSCSAPVAMGLIGVYDGFLQSKGLAKLKRKAARDFLLENVVDKQEEGHDYKSGYGLAILPENIPDIGAIENPIEPQPPVEVKPSTEIENTMSESDYQKYISFKAIYEGATKEGNLVAVDYAKQSMMELLEKYNLTDDFFNDEVVDEPIDSDPIVSEPVIDDTDEKEIEEVEIPKNTNIKLIIDAGHGGIDPGGSKYGYFEKMLTLVVAKRVKELLKDFDPAMTRESDVTLKPDDRTEIIKDNYDYCLSLHFNMGGGEGVETIHSIHSKDGEELATEIAHELRDNLELPLRRVFSRKNSSGTDYYYMHRNTGSVTTVIVEALFLDSLKDIKKLNVETIAQSIANGFIKHINKKVVVTPSPVEEPEPEEPIIEQLAYSGYLSKGDTGQDVRNLQTALKTLGYYNYTIDGSFGNITLTAVRKFQSDNGLVVDGYAGQGTRAKINEILSKDDVDISSKGYKTMRRYESNIHVFELSDDEFLDSDLGERFELEKVSKIINDKLNNGEKVVAGINGGFFNFNGSSEHLTLYIDEGLYYNPPSEKTVEFIYYKDGRVDVTNMTGYDKQQLSQIQADAHWGIGTSYSLIQDGKKNLENIEHFSHATTRQPRTMFGHNGKNFILVVADGRSTESKGLTAEQQAQVMLELGCTNAVNLDGGGSSTMVVVKNGKPVVMNVPSGNTERLVGSVLLVHKK